MTNLAQNNGTNNTEPKVINLKANIEANKEIMAQFKKLNSSHYEIDNFISDAQNYIRAITEKRMLCVIEKVSSSGMSRNIKFHSCEKSNNDNTFWYRQYIRLFEILGFTPVKNADSFRIGGCGMDMIFHTNYTIIHRLYRLGFISKSECEKLAQQTPVVL